MRTMLIAALAVAIVFSGTAFAGDRAIVVFKSGVSDVEKENLILSNGGHPLNQLNIISGVVFTLPDKAADKALAAILKNKNVASVEFDAPAAIIGKPSGGGTTPPPPPQTMSWGVDRVDADLAWVVSTGLGIKVAVVDTGIDLAHPDLKANYKGGINILSTRKTPADDNGHGTHCAGIIAAINNTQGVVGVAPGAYLYAVKVLNSQGSGWVSDIIKGLDWCISNKMQVVSMSLGGTASVDAYAAAIVRVYNAGIVITAAAGNDGNNFVNYPARYPECISVGATGDWTNNLPSDAIASFSCFGPEVDVCAPGVAIRSTYKGSTYATMSGTSMATPHVAGVVALMLKAGVWSYERLYSTADDFGTAGLDDYYGNGLIDAEEAVTGIQTNP